MGLGVSTRQALAEGVPVGLHVSGVVQVWKEHLPLYRGRDVYVCVCVCVRGSDDLAVCRRSTQTDRDWPGTRETGTLSSTCDTCMDIVLLLCTALRYFKELRGVPSIARRSRTDMIILRM